MMEQNDRSMTQAAWDAARKTTAAIRIGRAAMITGLKGAAVAAAKEALPFLVKLAIGLVIAAILVPMLVLAAMPNMFFGFETNDTADLLQMREQALSVGGAYMSLETFEQTQMDAIVTGAVSSYQNRGISIDEIDLSSSFDEEDLCWFIAINSVAHRQDLAETKPEDIQALCISNLRHTSSVYTAIDGRNVLRIHFKRFDHEQLMDDLGFDEDARTWAGALYETLWESDALTEYAQYFDAYKPSFSGDESYGGDYESGGSSGGGGSAAIPGSGVSTEIDISGFTDPGTKNNLDLAAYAIQAWENGYGYVWGTFGDVLTESLLDYKLTQYPDLAGSEDFIRGHWLNRRTSDCVGLIKGYGWLDTSSLTIQYGTNGMPDYTADQMYGSAEENGTDYGTMDTMPDIPGLALWKPGHIGVYIGGGYAVEAMGTTYGVVKTEVAGRGWSGWCKLPYIKYIE